MSGSSPRHGTVRRRVAAAAALLLVAAAGPSWAITAQAKMAFVEGRVEVLRAGSQTPVPAEVGMSLFPGDEVRTLRGKCQINFTASGILRLSPNTTAWFPTSDKNEDRVTVWNILAGKFSKNARQLFGQDDIFEVRFAEAGSPVSEKGPLLDESHPNHPEAVERWRQSLRQEIERLRAEGNAKLDAIRVELKQLEGKPITYRCAACGSNGPHRWTNDGWECNCGATAVSFGDYPTSLGAYNKVRDEYRRRIEEIERKIR